MEILNRDGLARIGLIETIHGKIRTPAVMPVINPNIITVPLNTISDLGFQAIITNGYIIRRSEKLRRAAEEHGIHDLLKFNGPIMTDSGTFQEYVYGGVEYGNVEMVKFQDRIGSDIITIRDIFTTPENSRSEIESAVEEGYARARSVKISKGKLLAGVIQGGLYPDLRMRSSKLMSKISDYLPIGGVVPLLENYRYADLVDVIVNSKLGARFDLPIHLFGGGHPMFMPMAVMLGVDTFDSSSYVKYARGNRLMFPEGTRDLSKLSGFPFWSPLNGRYSPDELRKAGEDERIYWISVHNLAAISMELSEIRERIMEGSLWQYVEWKSQAHPALREAFIRLAKYMPKLEKFQEISKKSPQYFADAYSLSNPYVYRIRKFTSRYIERAMDIREFSASYMERHSASEIAEIYEKGRFAALIHWNGIRIPMELEDTYPVQQSISARFLPGCRARYELPQRSAGDSIRNFDLEKLRVIAEYQYGEGTGVLLFPDGTEIRKSKKTGRIRTASLNGKITATMRAMDGFLTLTFEGAKLIASRSRRISIVVTKESAEFNSKGMNVFCKFVRKASNWIIPMNDTLVYSEDGSLVAVGKAAMSGREMKQFRRGVAVNVHEGVLE